MRCSKCGSEGHGFRRVRIFAAERLNAAVKYLAGFIKRAMGAGAMFKTARPLLPGGFKQGGSAVVASTKAGMMPAAWFIFGIILALGAI